MRGGSPTTSAERRATNAYPPNLDSIYEYITLYGGDPNWKPKVPDLREFDGYRNIAEFGPPVLAAREEVLTKAVAEPTPSAADVVKSKAVDAAKSRLPPSIVKAVTGVPLPIKK